VTDDASFEEVGDWIRLFQENAEKDAILVLVGNKTDLIEERRVTEEAAKTWAEGPCLLRRFREDRRERRPPLRRGCGAARPENDDGLPRDAGGRG
jgi:GTPase SAR1 family protein